MGLMRVHARSRATRRASANEALERQLQALRTQFSTELERTREQVAVAQVRASATERRALLEGSHGLLWLARFFPLFSNLLLHCLDCQRPRSNQFPPIHAP